MRTLKASPSGGASGTARSSSVAAFSLCQFGRSRSSSRPSLRPACLALALALIASPVLAAVSHEPLAFVRVQGAGASVADVAGMVARAVAPRRVPPMRAEPSRPIIHVPDSPVIVEQVGAVSVGSGGRRGVASGVASWYCGHGSRCTRGYPGGLYAAAGPALRVGTWRGRSVLVHMGGRSVRVTLIDCNCGPHANLIDLYTDVWDALGVPLSRGVLKVTVTW